MVKVKASKCTCGKCSTDFETEWEITHIDSQERERGEETTYEGVIDTSCPNCDNKISGKLEFVEYPVGVLSLCSVRAVSDEVSSQKTKIEQPDIYFYDL